MLAARDNSMKKALEVRDVGWLNILQHCKDSLRLNTQEQINNRCTLESIGKRKRKLVVDPTRSTDRRDSLLNGRKM